MNVRDIDPCDKSYFQKIIEKYGELVVSGVRTTEQVLRLCDDKFGITPSSYNELAHIDQTHFSLFDELLRDNGRLKNKDGRYKIFIIDKNEATKPFYDDYYERNRDYYTLLKRECRLFLFLEESSGEFSSSSSLFDSIIEIFKGIGEEEVINKTAKYFCYLSHYYRLDCFFNGI